MATATVPLALQDAPASHRLVYLVLANSPYQTDTLEEVRERAGVCRSTTAKALASLQDLGLVDAKEHRADGRRKAYTAATDADADEPTATAT